jgi:hypothetical protein
MAESSRLPEPRSCGKRSTDSMTQIGALLQALGSHENRACSKVVLTPQVARLVVRASSTFSRKHEVPRDGRVAYQGFELDVTPSGVRDPCP